MQHEQLATALEVEGTPLGYPPGWVEQLAGLLERAGSLSSDQICVDSLAMGEVLACEGLWEGKQNQQVEPHSAWTLRRELLHDLVLGFIRLHVDGWTISPLDYVHDRMTSDEVWDPLTEIWIHLMPEEKRLQLINEVVLVLSRLIDSWPQIVDGNRVRLGPVAREFGIGALMLQSASVDLVVGDHRVGPDALWPGAVLVRLVAGTVSPSVIETLSVDALIHAFATGCPPARVVVYSLTSGVGYGMDVERDWLRGVTGAVGAAAAAMTSVKNQEGVTVTPGAHCVLCPLKNECAASEADEYPF